MILRKIQVQSFRSLYSQTIDLKHSCIGLVGINEAGKTNVLDAIRQLEINQKLTAKDISKEANKELKIVYNFSISDPESTEILNRLNQFVEKYTKGLTLKTNHEFQIQLIISLNDQQEKQRSIMVSGIHFNEDPLFLKDDYKAKGYNLQIDENSVSIGSIWGLTSKVLTTESKNLKHNNIKQELISSIVQWENEKKDQEKGSVEKLEAKIGKAKENISKLDEMITFDIITYKIEQEAIINQSEIELEEIKKELENDLEKKSALDKLETKNQAQLNKLSTLNESIIEKEEGLKKLDNKIKESKENIEGINDPLIENYSSDIKIFEDDFSEQIQEYLEELIPQITFWTSKKEYILPTEILISDLLEEESQIPRPLLNIFRIGLNIKNEEELRSKLRELATKGSERSRANSQINSKVNDFIKGIWQDYDQDIQITIEKELIRIEVFDPEQGYEAKYYELIERSQGCKTFLSFILTIGAESKSDVFKNKILLLDEPETHLHPSGQRFLLKELIKISETNLVIYATHSNHLIIRKNYDQHLIIKKLKERTSVKPSQKDRIGFFMQEEVLYDALGVSLSSDLSTIEDYNFVFEGIGDLVLFKQFYDKVITAAERPYKMSKTKFYHGGKCRDIKKAFNSRPIQLGTKWIFILDSDKPADDLSKFILGRYRDYKDKDIFVFQYPKQGEEGELEDSIEVEKMIEVYQISISQLNIKFDIETLRNIISEKSYGVYSKLIIEKIDEDIKEEFNSVFKGRLNQLIIDRSKELNTIDKFQSEFPKYIEFAKGIIKEINEKK